MGFKCSVYGCRTNYKVKQGESKEETLSKPAFDETFLVWVKFVNRQNYKVTASSRICMDHFDEKFINRGQSRVTLHRDLKPIPTIYDKHVLECIPSSQLPTPSSTRKVPTERPIPTISDKMKDVNGQDQIKNINDLSEKICPDGFIFQKFDQYILYYRIFYDDDDDTPYLESIKVDINLHVKLHYKGCHIPLPPWFKAAQCRMTSVSMIPNFVKHMKNIVEEFPRNVLSEIHKIMYFKPQGRPPYSPEVLRFSLLQTSRQAYAQLLENFPLPSISLLRKLASGGIDSVKALQTLLKEDKTSKDVVLLVDEMYLQKSSEYHGGRMVGKD